MNPLDELLNRVNQIAKARTGMTNRKFYRTIIQVEVLSQEPLEYNTLDDVARAIVDDCSGKVQTISTEVLNGKEVAEALQDQESDPALFNLDEEGNDTEPEETDSP